MNKMPPCLCDMYSIWLHGAECANLYHGSSVWPSELKWTNNNADDDEDDKNCEDNKQTNKPTKKHMKTWHTSIWEWIIRFSYLLRIYLNEVCFSYPMLRSHLTNCLAQRTQHSRWYYLSITKFNVRCFIISFRLFACLWMVFVCVAFLVDLSDCLFYCIAWAFCPMPVSCPSVSVYVVAHSISSQFSYIWLSKADVLYSQQWILSLLYRFPSHGGQYIW